MLNIPKLKRVMFVYCVIMLCVYLLEADGCHGSMVKLFPEVLSQTHFFWTELLVSEQNSHLHGYFDHVLHHLLSFVAVSRVLFGHAVQFVQNLAAVVIYEHMNHRLTGHVTEDLLLGLHGHVLRAESLHPAACLHTSKQSLSRTRTLFVYDCVCVCVFTCVVQSEVFVKNVSCLLEEVASSAV